jgi:peptidoglycan/LPS O-acetylase OafA/YrhL
MGTSGAGTGPAGRVPQLDTVRACAALYVALHHATFYLAGTYALPPLLLAAFRPFRFSELGVDVFIVLSGYCLTISRRSAGASFGNFMLLRARRILPAYYATYVLALSLLAIAPGAFRELSTGDAFSPRSLVSHLLLIHNWWHDTSNAVDFPMWSIATEWQFYGLLPLVLVPAGRRWGTLGLLLAGAAIALGVQSLFPSYAGCPELLVSFCLGVWAAGAKRSRAVAAWGIAGVLGAAAAVTQREAAFGGVTAQDPLFAVPAGLAVAVLLVYLTGSGLRNRPLEFVGRVSYSLYLLHAIVLVAAHQLIVAGHLPLAAGLGVMAAAVGASVAAAAAFYRLFEEPWLRRRAERRAQPLSVA